MTNEVFIPFSAAAQDVFRMMLDLESSAGIPEAKTTDAETANMVNISIGITGDLSGEVHYCFPKETTLEMVKIMSGMEFEEVDEFVTSAMGEIANIISGNALIGLSEKEITCDLLPPQILYGQDLPVNGGNSALTALVKTGIGDVELHILLKSVA